VSTRNFISIFILFFLNKIENEKEDIRDKQQFIIILSH
jgi:hypothetical protein